MYKITQVSNKGLSSVLLPEELIAAYKPLPVGCPCVRSVILTCTALAAESQQPCWKKPFSMFGAVKSYPLITHCSSDYRKSSWQLYKIWNNNNNNNKNNTNNNYNRCLYLSVQCTFAKTELWSMSVQTNSVIFIYFSLF